MENLTFSLTPYIVQDLTRLDINAYCHNINHYITTTDGQDIILTGYRNSRLLYAVKTSIKTLKRESEKITNYIADAINENILYKTDTYLKEDCLFEKRIILCKSDSLNLLIDHDLNLIINRMRFIEQNLQWRNIDELVNQYYIALDKNNKRYIRYYRDKLDMLRHFDFILLSKNTYILDIYDRYLECLKNDSEVNL